jgi:hypothetical protein
MKVLRIVAVLFFSAFMCDAALAQPKFDSVVIKIKNIPIRILKEYSADHTNTTYKETFGPENWNIILRNDEQTSTKGVITITGYHGHLNGYAIWQELTLTPDTGLSNSYTIKYRGEGSASNNAHILTVDFSLQKISSTFDGTKTVFSVKGPAVADHIKSYVYETLERYEAPPLNLRTTKTISGDFTQFAEVTIQLFSSVPLAVKGSQTQTFTCYPNPASSAITITSLEPQEQVRIFDALGREVLIPEVARTDELVSLNTSSLPPGIYWLRTGSNSQKIVIER